MYFYESHMGGIYSSNERIDEKDLYCEQCGDSDWYYGNFDSAWSFLSFIWDEIDIDGSGGYDLEYILEEVSCFDDCPTYNEALKKIREWKIREESEFY